MLPKNATITITADPPEKGNEFDKWVPNASSNVKFEDEKSEVTKMTVLGGSVTVRATYKEKEIPGVWKHDLNVINGQGSGKYAYNKTVEITADPAPEGKEFDKWVVVSDTVTVTDITKAKTTLRTKGVDGWVVATYKDIGSTAVDHTLTVVNGSIKGNSNPGKFKRNEAVTLYTKEFKNFDKWVVTSGSVVAILPNEYTLNVTVITSDEDATIESTRKNVESDTTHTQTPDTDNTDNTDPNKNQKLSGISIKKLTAGKRKFTVKWKKAKKSESVSGYQIQYSTDKKFRKNVRTKKCGKKKNSLTVSKLKAKKKYYVRMRKFRNVKKDGKKSRIYGSWSKVKKVKVK